jgi:membrane protein YdbS with pleckstrin-like domain
MNAEERPTPSERGVAMVAAAIGFVVSLALAIFAVAVADNVVLWIRVCFVLLAVFFAWLLFFAPSKVRVAVARWFPWAC